MTGMCRVGTYHGNRGNQAYTNGGKEKDNQALHAASRALYLCASQEDWRYFQITQEERQAIKWVFTLSELIRELQLY